MTWLSNLLTIQIQNTKPVSFEILRIEVLNKIDLSDSHATEMADYLIATDLRGILSHGTTQLPDYVKSFQTLRYNSRPNIKIYRETVALL